MDGLHIAYCTIWVVEMVEVCIHKVYYVDCCMILDSALKSAYFLLLICKNELLSMYIIKFVMVVVLLILLIMLLSFQYFYLHFYLL